MPVPQRPTNLRIVGGPPPPPAGVLQPSDLTYLGSFQPPAIDGAGIPEGIFTGRRNGSVVTFFYKAGGHLVEFAAPGTIVPSPVNPGTLVKDWGNVWAGKMVDAAGNPISNLAVSQLYFDPGNVGLYTQYYDAYNAGGGINPSLLFTTLDDPGTSAFTTYGPWLFASATNKTNRFIGRIPSGSAFPGTYLGGRSLILGGVGTSSGNASSSWGPVLYAPATDLRINPAYPTTPQVGVTTLVDYPIDTKAPRSSDDWLPHNEPPVESASLWSQSDGYSGAGVWVKNATKESVVFLAAHGKGHIWYGLSADIPTSPQTLNNLTFTPGVGGLGPTITRSTGSFLTDLVGFPNRPVGIDGTTGGLNDKTLGGNNFVQITDYTASTITLRPTDTLVAQGPNAPGAIYIVGCGHHQTDVYSPGTTGPHAAGGTWPYLHIYDPAELGRVVTGAIQPYQAAWASATNLTDIGGSYNGLQPVMGIWFDAVAGRLYVCSPQMGPAYTYLPYIHVYAVAG